MTETRLKRSLSLHLVLFYGLGTMLGAGIYALVGEVAARAGMQAPLAFLGAAAIANSFVGYVRVFVELCRALVGHRAGRVPRLLRVHRIRGYGQHRRGSKGSRPCHAARRHGRAGAGDGALHAGRAGGG